MNVYVVTLGDYVDYEGGDREVLGVYSSLELAKYKVDDLIRIHNEHVTNLPKESREYMHKFGGWVTLNDYSERHSHLWGSSSDYTIYKFSLDAQMDEEC